MTTSTVATTLQIVCDWAIFLERFRTTSGAPCRINFRKNSDGKHYRLSIFIRTINTANQEKFNHISVMTGRKRVTEEFMEKVFSAVTLQVVKPFAEE